MTIFATQEGAAHVATRNAAGHAGTSVGAGADIIASVARLRAALAAAPLSARYTAGELETVYAFAHAQLARQRYAEALPIFAFLTQYAPTALPYLAGLGLCLQQVGRHDDAIQVHSFIALLAPQDLHASLEIAQSLLAQHRHDAAIDLLGLLARQAAAPGEAHPAATRAAALLTLLGAAPAGSAVTPRDVASSPPSAWPASPDAPPRESRHD